MSPCQASRSAARSAGGSGDGGARVLPPHVRHRAKNRLRRRIDHVDRLARERSLPFAADHALLAEEASLAQVLHV